MAARVPPCFADPVSGLGRGQMLRVRGGFYDIRPGSHGTRVPVGDVPGKGLGAVEAAAAPLGTFREATYHEPDPATDSRRASPHCPRRLAPPVRRAHLTPGETLLLTSAGVTEARDGAGVFYALADEVAHALAADPRAVEPRRLVDLVRDGTLRHCGGRLLDDAPVFAVRRADEPTGKGRLPP